MGGYNSGGHNRLKYYVEGTKRIDIREMQKNGELKLPGTYLYTQKWGIGGKVTDSIGIIHNSRDNFMTVIYTIIEIDTGAKEDRRDRISLDYVMTNYGKRAYFLCPYCKKRKATLSYYSGGFKCRDCAGLNYKSSQTSDKMEKCRQKAVKILKKLKYAPGWDCDLRHVPKPKNMHYKTYYKLLEQFQYAQYMRDYYFVQGCKRFGIEV